MAPRESAAAAQAAGWTDLLLQQASQHPGCLLVSAARVRALACASN